MPDFFSRAFKPSAPSFAVRTLMAFSLTSLWTISGWAAPPAESPYLGVEVLPYRNLSVTEETKAPNGTTTTTKKPESTWQTIDPKVDLFARFGNLAVRPRLDFGTLVDRAGRLRVGYFVIDNLEVGAGFNLERRYTEVPAGANSVTKTTNSTVGLGPYARFSLPIDPVVLEIFADLMYSTRGSESTTETGGAKTTVTQPDVTLWDFDVGVRAVYALTNQVEYTGGLSLLYASESNKLTGGGERSQSGFGFALVPAGLRLHF